MKELVFKILATRKHLFLQKRRKLLKKKKKRIKIDLQILPAHIKETDNYLSHARSVIDGVEVYF